MQNSGMMAQASNPSYSGDRDQEDYGKGQPRQKSLQERISTNFCLLGVCHPSCNRNDKKEQHSPGQPRHKTRPCLKNKH
jgi:hypothetical protein